MATAATSNSTNASPLGFGTTVGITSGPVFPGNSSAGGMIFVNNGPVVVAICPASVNLGILGVYSGFAAGVAVINGPGSININPGDKFIIDNLLATTAWNGIAAGPGASLTILTF
jgi:hypothetical protein